MGIPPRSWLSGHFLVSFFLVSLWSSQTGSGRRPLKGLSTHVHQPGSLSSLCSSRQAWGRDLGPKCLPPTSPPTKLTVLTEQTLWQARLGGAGPGSVALLEHAAHSWGCAFSALEGHSSWAHLSPSPGAGPTHNCRTAESFQMDQELQRFHCN